LHDYTGRHGDIWTDGQGRATFVVPSNAFGSGQSYLCFSRAGQDRAPVLHGHRTVQRFFGAADLDIAAIGNAAVVTMPRIFAAAHGRLQFQLEISRHGWTDATSVTLDVTGPAGANIGKHVWNRASGSEFDLRTDARGWHTLRLSASGLPAPQPFELEASYAAPQTL
jgi:alpha-amylase